MNDVAPEILMHAIGGVTMRDGVGSPPLRVINPAELAYRRVPVREHIVRDWLQIGTVTGNYGDGGTGKTLLSQQLQTACATGIAWAGQQVVTCKSFALYCEDTEEELHRRQHDINDVFGLQYAQLAPMRWISGIGDDWTLANFTNDGRLHATERWSTLVREVTGFGARLVILDTAADLFGGDENNRGQVRRFISLLGGLASDIKGTVLLNCHPSRSGLASGSLDGGSTAWSNSLRSRWSLARPDGDDVPGDTPDRVLTRRKANYASIGDTLRLRWTRGAFVPITEGGGISGAINRAAVEDVFLRLLDRCTASGIALSHSGNSGNYAPKLMTKRPDAEGYTAKELGAAMARLFTSNTLRIETYGRASDQRHRIARGADPVPPGSAE